MDRRGFLKAAGSTFASLALGLAMPWTVLGAAARTIVHGDRMYRWNGTGVIWVSLDGGKRWRRHIYLGDRYSVRRLALDRRGRLTATVRFSGQTFRLFLAPDRKSWRTI